MKLLRIVSILSLLAFFDIAESITSFYSKDTLTIESKLIFRYGISIGDSNELQQGSGSGQPSPSNKLAPLKHTLSAYYVLSFTIPNYKDDFNVIVDTKTSKFILPCSDCLSYSNDVLFQDVDKQQAPKECTRNRLYFDPAKSKANVISCSSNDKLTCATYGNDYTDYDSSSTAAEASITADSLTYCNITSSTCSYANLYSDKKFISGNLFKFNLYPKNYNQVLIGCADKLSSYFQEGFADGMVGLNRDSIVNDNLGALAPLYLASKGVRHVSICLSSSGSGKIRIVNKEFLREPEKEWIPLVSYAMKPNENDKYWLNVSDIFFSYQVVNPTRTKLQGSDFLNLPNKVLASIDSSSTFSWLPKGLFDRLKAQFEALCVSKENLCVPNSERSVDPLSLGCFYLPMLKTKYTREILRSFPYLVVQFYNSEAKLVIPPEQYLFSSASAPDTKINGETACIGILRSAHDDDRGILGMNMLFDYDLQIDLSTEANRTIGHVFDRVRFSRSSCGENVQTEILCATTGNCANLYDINSFRNDSSINNHTDISILNQQLALSSFFSGYLICCIISCIYFRCIAGSCSRKHGTISSVEPEIHHGIDLTTTTTSSHEPVRMPEESSNVHLDEDDLEIIESAKNELAKTSPRSKGSNDDVAHV